MAPKDLPKPDAPARVFVACLTGYLTAGEIPDFPARIELAPFAPLEVDEATAAYLLTFPGVVRLVPDAPTFPLAPPAEPSPLPEV